MANFKKLFGAAILAAFLFVTPAHADGLGIDMSATSQASAGTTLPGYTTSTEIGIYQTCSVYAILTGATGGTLDVYIQTAFKQVNASPVWVDVVHFPQVAAGAAAAGFALTLTRWTSTAASIVASLNTVSGTPAIAVNTVVQGILGYKLRTVYKTGAGTTVGAAQTVLAFCSGT